MSSEDNRPAPNATFIENRVASIAQKALQAIEQGKPFSVKIVMPQNVAGVFSGLQVALSSYTVELNEATSIITITNPNATVTAPVDDAPVPLP